MGVPVQARAMPCNKMDEPRAPGDVDEVGSVGRGDDKVVVVSVLRSRHFEHKRPRGSSRAVSGCSRRRKPRGNSNIGYYVTSSGLAGMRGNHDLP
jgi:hypothetical protein